jgi:hypothetical protein
MGGEVTEREKVVVARIAGVKVSIESDSKWDMRAPGPSPLWISIWSYQFVNNNKHSIKVLRKQTPSKRLQTGRCLSQM